MSVLIKGLRARTNDVDRRFGYLAFFSDGDVRKHTTNFPKTHCVRAVTASWQRWQRDPFIMGAPTVDGFQCHTFKGGWPVYEFFKSESEAVMRVKQALALTRGPSCYAHMCDTANRLNASWADDPYWASVEIVPVRVVWARGETLSDLRELLDPRLTVGTGSIECVIKGLA